MATRLSGRPRRVLEDVLDDFSTPAHARAAYGVVVDAVAETVDEAASKVLRERIRAGATSAERHCRQPLSLRQRRRRVRPNRHG